MYVSSHDNNIR